jgi:hypothetical protein
MKKNVGNIDRIVRTLLSFAIFGVLFAYTISKPVTTVLCVLAIYLLLSGMFLFCLFYKALGIHTN